MATWRRCAATGCNYGRRRLSQYCGKHEQRTQRYGHPLGAPIREDEMRQHEGDIADAFLQYADRKPMHEALRIAAELLEYQGESIVRYGRATGKIFAMLRHHEVTARKLLERVCVVSLLVRQDRGRRFPNKRAEDIATARAVLTLVRPHHMRPTAKDLAFMGCMVKECLGLFAMSLILRMEKDAERHRQAFNMQAFDEVVA